MSLATYTDLQTTVITRLGRVGDTELTTELPDFIALAEAKFNRELRCQQQETRITDVAAQYMTLPDDFLEFRRIHIQGSPNTALTLITQDDANNQTWSGASGRPTHYIIIGNTLQLVRAPDADSNMVVEYVYYAKIPALSMAVSTNWLLNAYPDLYVAATMFEGASRMQDANLAQSYAALTAGLISDLKAADRRARFSGGTLATRAA